MRTDFWNGKRVLITGVTGFMGAWLAKALIKRGAEVHGLDVEARGMLPWHGLTLPVNIGDIRHYNLMQHAVGKVDIVFHLAAISGVEHSRQLGMEALDINVRGTYTILEAARNCTPQPIVVVATSNHVYGPQPSLPAKEGAGLHQMDTYSASKICADVMTRAYWHNYGLPTAAVRNTNCFGPCSPHKDHIIEGTILSILKGEKPVIKSNGFTGKSYMHVEDTIDAYMFIAELLADHPGEAWNVADKPISVQDLVEMICRVMAWTGGIEIQGQANDQVDEWLDTIKLRSYGWKPKWNLEDAIKNTVDWFRICNSK